MFCFVEGSFLWRPPQHRRPPSGMKRFSTSEPNRQKRRGAMSKDSNSDATKLPFTFTATSTAGVAKSTTDGIRLAHNNVILPWIGFGTYKLEKDKARETILTALKAGYRSIDTAFVYGGETTERAVGAALQCAIKEGILQRDDLFLTTKHWRSYHGYDATLKCLRLSLQRLQVDTIDLYLMHWPGPAYNTMNRHKDVLEEKGPWAYAVVQDAEQMAQLRCDTWRAMEHAHHTGQVRAIGVSNFTVRQLQQLKTTAKVWPPAVNQVELHPLYPQTELLEYCHQEGIVVQAYASLGGQDTGQKRWKELELQSGEEQQQQQQQPAPPPRRKGKKQKAKATTLLTSQPVVSLAQQLEATPAQILLRWALDQQCVVIPKASTIERMNENALAPNVQLTPEQVANLTEELQANGDGTMGRLCWRRDPLRHLEC